MREEIRHTEDWIDREGAREGVENASFDKLIELGMGDGPKSAAAAHFLRRRGIPLQRPIHRYRNRDLTSYWASEHSPFDLSGEWTPQVDYFAEPTGDGVRVGFKHRTGSGFEVISREDDPEMWTTHPKYMRAVRHGLSRVVSTFKSESTSPLSCLSGVRSVHRSASEQRNRYASEGAKLLRKIRGALNALVHIGIGDSDKIPSVPPSDYILDTYPSRTKDGRELQHQRKLISEKYSSASLFRVELEKLWDFIRKREKFPWHFSSIMTNAGISESVIKQSQSVITSLYRDLKSIDDHIVQPASLEIACVVVEAKIVEANRIPSVEEVLPEISTIHHNRTVRIGKTLQRFKEENGHLPSFDKYGQLNAWLAEYVPKQFSTDRPDKDLPSAASYGNSLKATGCWQNESSGATKGLPETIREAVRYAKDNIER